MAVRQKRSWRPATPPNVSSRFRRRRRPGPTNVDSEGDRGGARAPQPSTALEGPGLWPPAKTGMTPPGLARPRFPFLLVKAGLDPAIQPAVGTEREPAGRPGMDGRLEPGHDERWGEGRKSGARSMLRRPDASRTSRLAVALARDP